MNKRRYKTLVLAVAAWIGFVGSGQIAFADNEVASAQTENVAANETTNETTAETTSGEKKTSSAWWARGEENFDGSEEKTGSAEGNNETITRPAKISGPWWTRTENDVETVPKNSETAPETTEKTDGETKEQETPKEPEKIDLENAKDISEPSPERAESWDSTRPDDEAVAKSMDELTGKTVVDVIFDGATKETYATARTAVSLRPGNEFSAEKINADREAIYATGYFYDLYPTFETVPEGVIVTYHVLENPVLQEINFTGNTVETDETINKIFTVKTGEILNSTLLHENIDSIMERYRKDGYIMAKITDINLDKTGVLNLKINEGILEGYKVKGNKKTKDYVILREMRQKVGEPFNAKLARRSMQRVYNLGFFEDVNIKMNPGVEPNAVEMELDVKEKRTGSFGIGAGYSTADGIIGMISVSDTNFRGRGDAVRIVYERSGSATDAHGYSITYRKPWLDRHETAGEIKIYNRTYEYDDYDTSGNLKETYMRKYSGGELSFSRPVSEYSSNSITLKNRTDSYVRHVSDGNAGNREEAWEWKKKNFGTTRSITLQHTTDTRDNIYNPMTGGKVTLNGEVAGFGGDFTFQKFTIEDQRYIKVGRAHVIALRGQYGVGRGNISEYNQYRIGGQDSLRGYRDDQFRGDRMILGTVEYRFPVMSKVQGAIFTDWGGAWDTGFIPKGTHASIGLGLAVTTPIGPLRIDYGYGSQGGRVHFNVGGMF